MDSLFLVKFISDFLNVPVAIVDNSQDFYNTFEKHHCFSPQHQQEFTADAVELFCNSIRNPCFYEIQSILGIQAILFPFKTQIILIGPYVEAEWDEKKASEILAQHSVPISYLTPYKFYYSKYRVTESISVLRTCTSAIKAIDPNCSPYGYQTISGIKDTSSKTGLNSELLDYKEIEMRYKLENEMLNAIRKGKLEEALAAYDKLRKRENKTMYPHRDLHFIIASFSSFRTMLRKAVEESGVNPVVIDSLSVGYVQKALAIKDTRQYQNLLLEMIYGYTKAVQDVLSENYSPAIRKATDYIKHHLGISLPLSDIAKASGLSSNYLSHAFKSETGTTVGRYIAQKRCEVAAGLLKNTVLYVTDISYHVGYSDSSYFVKVFKSLYGVTPTEYRQRHS